MSRASDSSHQLLVSVWTLQTPAALTIRFTSNDGNAFPGFVANVGAVPRTAFT